MIGSFVEQFESGDFANLISTTWNKEQKQAEIAAFPDYLSPVIAQYLENLGYAGLYSHQVESIHALHEGSHIIIATGTSSGKTLCYNLPVYQQNMQNPDSTALYIFPTKALTEDQYKKISNAGSYFEKQFPGKSPKFLRPGIYDGDTPQVKRTTIRKYSNIILTNPDMLHIGILPHHTNWAKFLGSLKFIVLDEVHTYRGVFGSHVANVIRRLKRVLDFYGADPQFILASATIQNPGELASRLVEENFTCVTHDGSYQTERSYFFLNPPIVDRDLGLRRGLIDQSVEVAEKALRNNIQSIIFARSRKTVELTVRELRQRCRSDKLPDLQGYRSGYLPKDRRSIETGLREGLTNAVISTNAMELGIDMGGVDAVLLMGYPGSIASFLQQSGRAGRRERPSAAVLIASSSPLDQYIIRHPEFVRGKNPERALLDPDNPLLLLNHLRCALFELPFDEGEHFGNLDWPQIKPYLDVLMGVSQAIDNKNKIFWMSDGYPANEISLRNIGGQAFQLRLEASEKDQKIGQVQSILLGEVDYQSAARTIHPEAIYLHNGVSYRVETLDYDNNLCRLTMHDGSYFTEPKVDSQIEIIESQREEELPRYEKLLAEIKVIEQVVGFKKVDWLTREILSHHELELPPDELQTIGFAIKFGEAMVATMRANNTWTNDPNQYGSQWPKIRKTILERDEYRCQLCGAQGTSANLHVHHKVPFRTYNSIMEANQPGNLVTLCPICHRIAEQNVKIRSGLGGLGYLFAQIAPLHLMCDHNDIGYFIDPTSKYNQKQPILIVYDLFPGGIGLSAALFDAAEQVLLNCKEVIENCSCKDGCPACVGPAGENGDGGKQTALEIISQMLISEEHNG